jgi:hypothetical protein
MRAVADDEDDAADDAADGFEPAAAANADAAAVAVDFCMRAIMAGRILLVALGAAKVAAEEAGAAAEAAAGAAAGGGRGGDEDGAAGKWFCTPVADASAHADEGVIAVEGIAAGVCVAAKRGPCVASMCAALAAAASAAAVSGRAVVVAAEVHMLEGGALCANVTGAAAAAKAEKAGTATGEAVTNARCGCARRRWCVASMTISMSVVSDIKRCSVVLFRMCACDIRRTTDGREN